MNPVAANAQASVPVPEGLDLDEWFVPPPPEQVDKHEAIGVKAKKKHKGKGKEHSGAKSKSGKKQEQQEQQEVVVPQPEPVETEEERAEKENRKAERLERMRDDPYYLVEDRPKPAQDDIDSIPVVRLDDLPHEESRLPSLRDPTYRLSSQSFVIDKDGEMPEGVVLSPPQRETPPVGTPTSRASSFPPYEEDPTRSSTPEPIKVTRAKKKGTASGKKKRTAQVD